MTSKRVYMAGPLFTVAELDFNYQMHQDIQVYHSVFLPQEFCRGMAPDFLTIAETCIKYLDKSDIVLANLDGSDVDSGTAFECGYAYAKSIPIVGYRTDLRTTADALDVNAMLLLCDRIVRKQLVEEGMFIAEIHKALNELL